MTAFRPGASPPPVEIAMRMSASQVPIDQADDLPLVGVPTDLELREHELPVDRNLERPAGRFDQPHGCFGIPAFNLGRQTGGPWLVVSDDAVLDADEHRSSGQSDAPTV